MASSIVSTFSFSDNVIGFIIDGPYDEAIVTRIQNEIGLKLEVFEKVNFYIEVTNSAKISQKAILKSLPFKYKSRKRYEKVAVVTDRKWLQFISNLERLFFKADIRIFTTENRIEAIQWISH